ncbi:hypothetical protein DWG18_00350 [Lysobacter sp. TY2-98]|nr:hypothetical protein DWG18_00350 [Lysobacter sp. TY2-98]
MHRSGTSATAGALRHFGVALGSRMLAPGPDNPTGYWEHEDAVDIHDRLLDALERRWDDVRALPPGWRSTDAAAAAEAEIRALVKRDFAAQPIWAIKDPRICRFLPIWTDVLRETDIRATAMIVARHPLEVAASLEKRNGWPPRAAVLLWLRYVLDAVRDTRGLDRAVIRYADLIEDPVRTIGEAMARLGLDATVEPQGLRDFVDPGARHHVAPAQADGDGVFLKLATDVYDTVEQIAAGRAQWDDLDARSAAFDALWAERADELDAFAAMVQRLETAVSHRKQSERDLHAQVEAHTETNGGLLMQLDTLSAGREELASKLAAQLRWSEDAVARHDALQLERDELRSQLTAQIRWSEDAAERLESLQAERDELRSQLKAQIRWSDDAAARLESLQAERDELRSQLTAQVRWSENAAARLEAMQAERDGLSSRLTAQINWSEAAAVRLEATQAERDEINSKLIAQIRWSEEAVARHQALQAEHAELESQLTAQLRWADEAVDLQRELASERDRLRTDVERHVQAGIEAEAVRAELEGALIRARTDIEQLRTHAGALAARLEASEAVLAETLHQANGLQVTLDAIYRSHSWRVTRPLRALAAALRPRAR